MLAISITTQLAGQGKGKTFFSEKIKTEYKIYLFFSASHAFDADIQQTSLFRRSCVSMTLTKKKFRYSVR